MNEQAYNIKTYNNPTDRTPQGAIVVINSFINYCTSDPTLHNKYSSVDISYCMNNSGAKWEHKGYQLFVDDEILMEYCKLNGKGIFVIRDSKARGRRSYILKLRNFLEDNGHAHVFLPVRWAGIEGNIKNLRSALVLVQGRIRQAMYTGEFGYKETAHFIRNVVLSMLTLAKKGFRHEVCSDMDEDEFQSILNKIGSKLSCTEGRRKYRRLSKATCGCPLEIPE